MHVPNSLALPREKKIAQLILFDIISKMRYEQLYYVEYAKSNMFSECCVIMKADFKIQRLSRKRSALAAHREDLVFIAIEFPFGFIEVNRFIRLHNWTVYKFKT